MGCPENDVMSGAVICSQRTVSGEALLVATEYYGDVLVLLTSAVWKGLPARPGERIQITGVTDVGECYQALQACVEPANYEEF